MTERRVYYRDVHLLKNVQIPPVKTHFTGGICKNKKIPTVCAALLPLFKAKDIPIMENGVVVEEMPGIRSHLEMNEVLEAASEAW